MKTGCGCILAMTLLVTSVLAKSGPDESWSHYGADAGGRRYSPHTQINPENIVGLQIAWVYRTGDASSGNSPLGRSTFKSTPILHQGRLYFSTPFNRVIALDASTGAEIWSFDPEVDFSIKYAEMFTSRGVSVWSDGESNGNTPCQSRILLGTLDARLFAIDAMNGKRCKDFGNLGEIDLSVGIKNFRRGQYSVTSPPAVIDDLVIVGSSVGDNGAVELDHGEIRAFDVRSGKLRWSWDPIPRRPGMPGFSTWDKKGASKSGAANAWSIISVDPKRQLVFIPTTSPSPDFYGGQRPGDNLFANSVVALHAASGKIAWHFQTVHHDLWDYDLAPQPMLTTLTRHGVKRPVVIQATKMGHIFVLDRQTGVPVFPIVERPVPQTDVPGERTSKTQPFPILPRPLHPESAGIEDIWAYTPEHAQVCRELFAGVRSDGMYTPPSLNGTLVYPGNPGGVNWGSMAVHEQAQIALTIVKRWPTIVTLIPRREFRTRAKAESGGPLGAQFTAQSGTPFGMKRHGFFNPKNGLPCLKGPWGTLVAIDLHTGQILWETPVGVWPGLEDHPLASGWGTIPAGGPIVTQSRLVFAATDDEAKLFAYRLMDGELIWSTSLPAAAQSTPMTYMAGGQQFVVITAGGAQADGEMPGDFVIAFSLAPAKRACDEVH